MVKATSDQNLFYLPTNWLRNRIIITSNGEAEDLTQATTSKKTDNIYPSLGRADYGNC